MINNKQLRYLSQSIQLQESITPRLLSGTVWAIALAVVVFMAWATATNVSVIARASGEIVPRGFSQSVQHLEGGIVTTIHVEDGDVVQAGSLLLELESAGLQNEFESAAANLSSLEMEEMRLRAFIAGTTPDFSTHPHASDPVIADQMSFYDAMVTARIREVEVVERQLAQRHDKLRGLDAELIAARASLAIAQEVYQRRSDLESRGLSSTIAMLDDRRRRHEALGRVSRLERDRTAAQEEIAEFEKRKASLHASHRDDANEQLSRVIAQISQTREMLETLRERQERLAVVAPVDGVVKGMTLNTIGAVVPPGQTLMTIVPTGRDLELVVDIAPQDIGFIDLGQTVSVKVTSFDFTRHGTIDGALTYISATSFENTEGVRMFQGRVRLDETTYDGRSILPGMTATADIVTGSKTVMQYLLRPIHASLATALGER